MFASKFISFPGNCGIHLQGKNSLSKAFMQTNLQSATKKKLPKTAALKDVSEESLS
jgi:outer membrane lipopolysaccharide assembly protein LptE/RlpB